VPTLTRSSTTCLTGPATAINERLDRANGLVLRVRA
jgi:hypothetical protein